MVWSFTKSEIERIDQNVLLGDQNLASKIESVVAEYNEIYMRETYFGIIPTEIYIREYTSW